MISAAAGTGAQLAANATAWSILRVRDAKEYFQYLNPKEVLEKLAALPVTKWNYKHDPRQKVAPNNSRPASAIVFG